jgi:hypothetical protein
MIESQFLEWYEAENNGESVTTFRLESHSCLYHLESKKDTSFISDQLLHIEFVEYETIEENRYFRIGLMKDHEMSLVYFLKGTIEQKIEGWLRR